MAPLVAIPPAPPAPSRIWPKVVLLSPLLAALPLAAYAVILFLGLRGERAADLRGDLHRSAAGMSAVVETEIGAGLVALQALAASPRITTGVLSGFREEAARVLALHPGWYTIVLADADRQVMNLRHPSGAPLPAASEMPAGDVLQTGLPGANALSDGRVVLRVPVRVDGSVRYALIAVLPALSMGKLLDRVGLPTGWSALLFDGEGRVLARAAGSNITRESLDAALADPGRTVAVPGGMGLARLFPDTRWRIALAAPEGDTMGSARRWLLAALGLSAIFAGLGIALRIALRQRRQEKERAARAAEEAAQREEQERRRNDLLATVSHELRTPLTGLLGYTDLLARADLPSKPRGWVEQQRRAGQALLALIGDVLDFARLQDGAIELEDTDVDLPALIEDCAGILRSLAQQKALPLVVVIDPGLPRWIRGDPHRLRQVVTNLLGNAIKFTSTGQVTVGCRLLPRPPMIEVAVADTGAGISAEALPFVFDRFRQARADTARRYGGSGLGLAISRRLITAMGGEIDATSEPGKGSRFAFRVPFRPGAAPATRRSGRLRILVAEDVAASRMLLTAVLERAGHEVTATEDGARALAAMHGAQFDMVLMDINMPGLDGYGVATAVRALPGEQSRVPMVALTADAPEEIEPRCRAAGFDAVLRKPYETRRLLGLIEALRNRTDAAPPQEAATVLVK